MQLAIFLIADSADRAPIAALGDFKHRVVEFLARRDIDRRRKFQRLFRTGRWMSADHRDDRIRIRSLDCFGGARIHPERRSRSMNHDQVVILRLVDSHLDGVIMRGRIEQTRTGNHSRWISEPSRVPERPDLAGRLISRAGATVEVVVRGRVQEEGLHHVHRQSKLQETVRVVSPSELYKPQPTKARFRGKDNRFRMIINS